MENIYDITIEAIENNLNIVRSLYDSLRVVDLQNKKTFIYNKGSLFESEATCYKQLGKERLCENCISIRALNNKSTFMKIESIEDKVFMITAVPVELHNRTVVVELIKDVTNSLFYGNTLQGESCKVSNVINEIKELAIKDELTDIYNRRYISERLPIDIENSISSNKPISIIMTDIDFFKKVNDTFGHIYGDNILRQFTKRLKKCIRGEKDWIARYGGEEFLICIPEADNKIAYKIAERMRNAVSKKEMIVKDKKIQITASFGIYTIHDKSKNMEEFIDSADKKLYEAKSLGRNQIVG
jgi:diguanylate cyclase (GGDEF)-like protein